jgi:hypothetical protein
MMLMRSFKEKSKTELNDSESLLQRRPCGLHRAKLTEASELIPELSDLFDSVPVGDPENWEIDIKLHMLTKGQFPCIPNWHCDNVPQMRAES